MTMKHPRDNENLLLGSDHSKQKRPRTGSDLSESSSIENKSSQCNTNQQHQQHAFSKPNHSSNQVSATTTTATTHSPRMMALLSSLEVLDDSEAQKLQHKWPRASSPSPPALAATAEAAAAFLQQKNYAQPVPKLQQPLIARPRVHKITERSPVDESSATNTNTTSAASTAAPSPETVPNTKPIAASAYQFTNYKQFAPNLATVAVPRTTHSTTTTVPSIGPKTVVVTGTVNPLDAFLFPLRTLSNKNTIQSSHTNFPVTARQIAIHNAVHSDYKKTYKPLQRPPRLPTAHEALVMAAISTGRTAPSCR